MAFKKHLINCSLLLVVLSAFQSIYLVYGNGTIKEANGLEHKGTIKTIEGDNGDIIDCVDIHKQPAFDNPLINDLQMKPSSYPDGIKQDPKIEFEIRQDWNKNEECPEGTIPIRRNSNTSYYEDYHKKSFFTMQYQGNQSLQRSEVRYEYAMAIDEGSPYYGTQAVFNVWNPLTKGNEFSASQLWITSSSPKLNTIEVGWMVYPNKYGNTHTHFFIYWTADNYQKTGCFDFDCPGFVQTHRNYAIGATISPTSTYGGNLHEVSVNIFKDIPSGNWWLVISGYVVGYWPKSIFTGLADHATSVKWGGEILNSRSSGHHTTTQMGSGHFSGEGYHRSSYIRQLKVADSGLFPREPGYLTKLVTTPSCYNLNMFKNPRTMMGTHIYFGGPGFSSTCT
ncbi:uncharacterized protein LOC124943193 [Impatiens glandulifera]|uniref:uncharacterized protein LOC124943193 n=1 Tax=Impatiens glandulifera TaxID=253017 RepID=UPI001FB18320|nr:uncharacterized protein LOC124943193 [Impatiens glandulifera]